jgi:hypothetical protein
MALKKLVGLAALGGFLYAHKRRGGQLTIDSFKETARGLLDDVKNKARDIRSQAEQRLQDQRVGTGEYGTSRIGDDVTGYGSSGYGYSNPNRR